MFKSRMNSDAKSNRKNSDSGFHMASVQGENISPNPFPQVKGAMKRQTSYGKVSPVTTQNNRVSNSEVFVARSPFGGKDKEEDGTDRPDNELHPENGPKKLRVESRKLYSNVEIGGTPVPPPNRSMASPAPAPMFKGVSNKTAVSSKTSATSKIAEAPSAPSSQNPHQDTYTRERLLAQYERVQMAINEYIEGEYYSHSDIKRLPEPHPLYKTVNERRDVIDRKNKSPAPLIVSSPNSHYLAMVANNRLLVFNASSLSHTALSKDRRPILEIFIEPYEQICFTPDSSKILLYSCVGIRMHDVEKNNQTWMESFGTLAIEIGEMYKKDLKNVQINKLLSIGRFTRDIGNFENHIRFTFFCPFYTYTFRLNKSSDSVPHVVINVIDDIPNEFLKVTNGVEVPKKISSGGDNIIYLILKMGARSLQVFKTEFYPSNNFSRSVSCMKVKQGILEVKSEIESFSVKFDDLPISEPAYENNVGITLRKHLHSPAFFDSENKRICIAHYTKDRFYLENLLNISEEVRLVTSFQNNKFFALISKDSYLKIYMSRASNEHIQVAKLAVRQVSTLAMSSDNHFLFIVSEIQTSKGMGWDIQSVPIMLNYGQPTQLFIHSASLDFKESRFIHKQGNDIFMINGSSLLICTADAFSSEMRKEDIEKQPENGHYVASYSHFCKKTQGIVFYLKLKPKDDHDKREGLMVKILKFSDPDYQVFIAFNSFDQPEEDIATNRFFSVSNDLTTCYLQGKDGHMLYKNMDDDQDSYREITIKSKDKDTDNPAISVIGKPVPCFRNLVNPALRQRFHTDYFFDYIENSYIEIYADKETTRVRVIVDEEEVIISNKIQREISLTNLLHSRQQGTFIIWGAKGLAEINLDSRTVSWKFAPDSSTVLATEEDGNDFEEWKIQRVEYSPNGKYLIVDMLSQFTRLLLIRSIEKKAWTELHREGNFETPSNSYWDITSDSSYLIYATQVGARLLFIDLRRKVTVSEMILHNPLMVKFIELTGKDINIYGLLINKEENKMDHVKLSNSIFTKNVPLEPRTNSLIPLIQHQMILHFTTDSSIAKAEAINNMLELMAALPHHIVLMNSIYTIIIFMMNSREGLSNFSKRFQPIEVMLERHRLMRLFFLTDNSNSTEFVVDAIEGYVNNRGKFPFLDEEFIKNLINTGGKYFMKNPASQIMMKNLLFSPYCTTTLSELDNPLKAVTHIRESDEDNLRSNVIRESYRFLLKENPINPTTFTCYETRIRLNLDNGSKFSKAFFRMIARASDQDLMERYFVLVNYKWDKLFKIALVYSLIYWTMTGLYYIYLGDYYQYNGLAFSILIGIAMLLLFEVKCATNDGLLYFKSLWNIFDILSLIAGAAVTVYFMIGIPKTETGRIDLNWCRGLTVMLFCFRSITHFKIFGSMRYVITMLLKVFEKMLPFIFILSALVVSFGFLWKVSPGLSQDTLYEGNQELNFYESIQTPIGIIFGNSPEADDNGELFGTIRFIILLVMNIVLALIMLNFLIAIISATFEIVSEDRMVYDAKDLLDIIIDLESFCGGWCWVNEHRYTYFVSLIEQEEENKELSQIELVGRNIKIEVSLLAEQVGKMEKKIDRAMDLIEKSLSNTNSSPQKKPQSEPRMDESEDIKKKNMRKSQFSRDEELKNAAVKVAETIIKAQAKRLLPSDRERLFRPSFSEDPIPLIAKQVIQIDRSPLEIKETEGEDEESIEDKPVSPSPFKLSQKGFERLLDQDEKPTSSFVKRKPSIETLERLKTLEERVEDDDTPTFNTKPLTAMSKSKQEFFSRKKIIKQNSEGDIVYNK